MLVIGAEPVPVIVQARNLTVIRYDEHVCIVESAFFPVLVHYLADALISHELQVANLTRERIFRYVGKNIDAGKVDDL